ncbi:MAG: hypothetical protein WA123_06770 [Methylotenera sp.]
MKKFILTLILPLFIIVNSQVVLAESKSDAAKYKRLVDEAKNYSKEIIESSKNHFVCGGIGIIDRGSAMDRPTYFFKDGSREFSCSLAMGNCLAANLAKDCSEICPPPEWKVNDCDSKYLLHINRGTTKVAPFSKEIAEAENQLLLLAPIGSDAKLAKPILEQKGFKCNWYSQSELAGVKGKNDYLYCDVKTVGVPVPRRWQIALIHKNFVVTSAKFGISVTGL